MRTLLILPLIAALAAVGCTRQAPDCGDLTVSGAWVRAAPSGADIAAGYLTADNPGASRVLITGGASPDFDRVEMHRSVAEDGQMRMERTLEVAVPAGGTVAFEPGGRHLMLFGPRTALEPGGRLQMRLVCGEGEVAFTAEVRAQAPAADHQGH